ncbi:MULTISPECIES: hypothetical protein [unclassified Butyrivibrio]|jgi:hypothetical protein|uniref:hypothetical protein n=1 Tax=unclassified Butyrivibrio TaxID=2639466 RepID=UPI0003B74258|nr:MULTISPECIES: hypothetical protein [unclassified Butyrivibrio]MBE5826984.1 hypothetical protein [Butyrivibrio sp.]SDB13707.1 hypothetical protein SAMN02910263_00631 [Butyrivibrio sp. INlla16]
MSKGRERQRANKRKAQERKALNCSRFSCRDLNPIPQGGIKPQNCKTPCSYGTGKPFCYPCMAKIMDEHRNSRKAA